jgi:hypothetical protein
MGKRFVEEEEAWEKAFAGEKAHGKCPTYRAISKECLSVGFNVGPKC